MKNLNKLEKHLKSTAEKQESTPPSFVWDEIDKALPKKKDKKRFFFLWFIIGISIFGLVVIQQGYFSTEDKTIREQAVISENLASDPSSDNAGDNKITNNNKALSEINNVDVGEKVKQDLKSNAKEEKKKSTELESNLDLNYSKEHRDLNASTGTEAKIIPSTASSLTLENTSPILVQKEAANNSVTTLLTDSYRYPGSKSAQNKNEESLKPVSQHGHSLENLQRLNLINFQIDANGIRPMLALDNMNFTEFMESTSNPLRPNNKFFVEFGSMIGIHNTHLINNDTTQSYRLGTESNWYTWGAKVSLGYRISNNIYLRSGINFIESRDKFTFEKESVQLIPALSAIAYSTNKITYFNIGDITYRQWNIPLTVGYEKKSGKFIYGIEVTAMYNMSFKSEGKTQIGPTEFSRVENENLYKNRLGFGYTGALLVGTTLSESSALYAKPSYSRYLSKTSLETTSVESTLSLYYLEFAYRKRF